MRGLVAILLTLVGLLWAVAGTAATIPPDGDFTVSVYFQERVTQDDEIDFSTGQIVHSHPKTGFTNQSVILHSSGMTVERHGDMVQLLRHGVPVFHYDAANQTGMIDLGSPPQFISSYSFDGSRGSYHFEDDDDPVFRLKTSELRGVTVLFTPLGVAATPPSLNPVPVPASLPLLLAGLGAFWALRRRMP